MNADNIIEFVMDPLRLTLIVAGVVVVLAILILGRRSSKQRDMIYSGSSRKEYSFNSMPDDMLVDEEVIVLPRRKKESDLLAESDSQSDEHFSAKYDEQAASGTEQHVEATIKKDLPLPGDSQDKPESQQTVEPKAQADVKQSQPAQAKKPAPVQQQFVVLYVIAAEGRAFTGKAIFESTQTLGMALGKHNVFHYPADAAYVGDSAFCMVNMTPEGSFDIEHLDDIQTNGVSLILTLPTMYSDGLTVFSNMLAVAQALSKKLGGDIIDQTRMPLTAELVTNMRADIENFESRFRQKNPVMES